jgi:serine protease
MRKIRASIVGATLAVVALQAAFASNPDAPGAGMAAKGGAERSRVYVAYHPGSRGVALRALAATGAEMHHDFPSLATFAVSLPSVAIEALAKSPAIEYIEPDAKRYFASDAPYAETIPYGVRMVQALQVAEGAAANNVMVCVIDTGIDYGHPDLPNSVITGTSDSAAGNWFTDVSGHGTHVAGTIAAVGSNGKGTVGVAAKGLIPLHVIKTGDFRWTYSSTLVAALNACESAAGGRRLVVNMSLGGPTKNRTEERGFNDAQGRGVLSIAAAGNGRDTSFWYPASYNSVISVGAVDYSGAHAAFSQQNSQVELAAPGVMVLSTLPRGTTTPVVLFAADGTGYEAFHMEGLGGTPVLGEVNAQIVDCAQGTSRCENASGKICLIERGDGISLADQVLNCEAGDGTAAVIYNNTAGWLSATLGSPTNIPSVGITRTDGLAIRDALHSKGSVNGTVFLGVGIYGVKTGTSMATPHVAGVAALVWSHFSGCTNTQVRSALTSTALDLGAAGRDNLYGFGLVQAKAALDTLGSVCGTSGGGGGGGGSGGGKGGKK